MAAGSIVIDLLMRTGSFETDTGRAAKKLRAFEKDVVDAGKRIATGAAAIVAGIGGSLAVVERLAESVAQYQDIAEKIGDSASAISSLQLAADTSGTALDSVAAASVKLTAALSKTDDEGDAVAKALAAINIPLADFKRLSPTEQIDAVAQALAGFEDGAAKTAVAVALFGKAGAELLPFLNDLADKQRKALFTDEQIKRADDFTKQMGALRNELGTLAKVAGLELIEPFSTFVGYLNDAAKAGSVFNTVAQELKTSFQKLAVFAADIALTFQVVGIALGALGSQMSALARLDFSAFSAISAGVRKDIAKANAEFELFAKRIGQGDGFGKYRSLPDQLSGESRRLGLPGRQELKVPNFGSGNKGAGGAKEQIDQAARSLAALSREIETFGKDADFGKLLAFQDLKPTTAQLEQFRTQLEKLAELRNSADLDKFLKDWNEELASDKLKQHNALLEEGRRLTEDLRTPLEVLTDRYEKLNRLLAESAINGDTYRRAVGQAQEEFAKATDPIEKEVKKIDDAARELGLTFSSAFEDAIVGGKGFSEVLKGLEADILRIITRKLVTEPLANAITGALGGGGADIGSLFGTLLGSFGGALAGGGDVMPGRRYLVGEQGPEMFVPRTAGSIVPSASGSGASTRALQQTNNFYVQGAIDHRTQQQLATSAGRHAQLALARGGA